MKFEKMVIKSNQEEAIEGLSIEYPYVMHLADLNDTAVPWHWHEEVEFGYVIAGAIDVVTANKKYTFHQGEAFFVNANVLCCMHKTPQSHSSVINSHLFHPTFLGGHYKSIFETKYLNPILQNRNADILEIRGGSEAQRDILQLLRQAADLQKETDAEFETRNTFSKIWLLLKKEQAGLQKDTQIANLQNQDRIQTMLFYIHQNYMEKITLEEISASASIGSRECLRCFRDTVNKSPIEYLMDYRLQKARELLKKSNMNVTDIGLQTGFSSNAYFGKIFRERCRMTPVEYRKKARCGILHNDGSDVQNK